MKVMTAKYRVDPSEIKEHKSHPLKDLPVTLANFPAIIIADSH